MSPALQAPASPCTSSPPQVWARACSAQRRSSRAQTDAGSAQVIHVAAQANLAGTESLTEIVQHEFGHAISVLTQQDRSEAAAIAYAASH